jgi:hypothetical protein
VEENVALMQRWFNEVWNEGGHHDRANPERQDYSRLGQLGPVGPGRAARG